MKTFLFILIILIPLFVLFSCKKNKEQHIDSNVIYHDMNMLGKILKFSNYKPDKVMFKYSALLNSIEGEQSSLLPEPKKYYVLEAVLFFNPKIIEDIKKKLNDKAMYPKDENELIKTFQFNWLPDSIKNEINKIKIAKEYPGSIFDTGDSSMIILPDKVIIYALP